MRIPKPTDADKDRFRDLVPTGPGVEVKAMFGNLGAFVNGNMFAGLFGADVGVKLADHDRRELTAAGAGPFGPADRPMGGYVALPAGIRDHPEQASEWIHKALEHVASLPAKRAKAKRAAR